MHLIQYQIMIQQMITMDITINGEIIIDLQRRLLKLKTQMCHMCYQMLFLQIMWIVAGVYLT